MFKSILTCCTLLLDIKKHETCYNLIKFQNCNLFFENLWTMRAYTYIIFNFLFNFIPNFICSFLFIGCTIISMMPLPRLLYALSEDGLLPGFFAKVHPNTNVPVISTVISGFMVGMCDHFSFYSCFLSFFGNYNQRQSFNYQGMLLVHPALTNIYYWKAVFFKNKFPLEFSFTEKSLKWWLK